MSDIEQAKRIARDIVDCYHCGYLPESVQRDAASVASWFLRDHERMDALKLRLADALLEIEQLRKGIDNPANSAKIRPSHAP